MQSKIVGASMSKLHGVILTSVGAKPFEVIIMMASILTIILRVGTTD